MAVRTETRPDLGEVKVETGTGILTLTDPTPQSRNAKVEIKATHRNLEYPVKGWVDTKNRALWDAVLEADRRKAEVDYVIVTKRGRNAPDGVALDDLPAKQKIRDLESLRPTGSDGHQASPVAPESASPPHPAPSAEPPPPSGTAQERARAMRASISPPAPVEEPVVMTSEEADYVEDHGGPPPTEDPPPTAAAGARMSTWAYMDTLAIAELAWDKVLGQGHGASPARARALAQVLLRVADQAQVATFGRVDRADQSRPRIRGAIRTALDSCPVPWGADDKGRAEWSSTLLEFTVSILELGLELLGRVE